MNKLMLTRDGFSIIELLIAIVVIGILAVLALSTFGGANRRAEAAAAASDLASIQRAIIAAGVDQDIAAWWTENELEACDSGTITSNPYLDEVAGSCPGFDSSLQEATITLDGSVRRLRYDNEGDATTLCGSISRGLTLFTHQWSLSDEVLNELDKVVDGSDGRTCGKVRWASPAGTTPNRLFYIVDFDAADVEIQN